ncbi:MAG: glycosyltransferase [Salaquimonas sp.]|nr:glycosyltransferase [Salaquimonas sp.]
MRPNDGNSVKADPYGVAGTALPADIAFLERTGLPLHLLAKAAAISDRTGIAASEILIHRGVIAREDYERRLAAQVGAQFSRQGPDPGRIVSRATASVDELRAIGAKELLGDRSRLFVSPQASGYARVATLANKMPDTFRRAVFTGQVTLRRSLFEASRQGYARRAVNDLAKRLPVYSARRRLTSGQAVALVFAGLLIGGGVFFDLHAAFVAAAVFLAVFYLASILLRAMLIVMLDISGTDVRRPFRPRRIAPEELPVYSILVALKGEAGQVAHLVAALDRLDWPVSKREVFLVCEEDDPETIQAIRRLDLPEGFEVIVCPPCEPRTKPKALDYALPLCSGRYTVIYDAEDRPHKLQLREAFEKLEAGGERLACVQAPLLIHNRTQSWLTRLFAIEYRTQFLGTLPLLERLGAPLSLGGTSNHFRTELLRAAGGWDPFNVTEDADLGIRLARLGRRCGTITCPTHEEAPPIMSVWMKQRTRWLKGWLQTMLVHSRNPLRTARELGATGSLFFHLTITAIVVSMLIHPFFLAYLAWQLASFLVWGTHGGDTLLLGISLFNLVGGYTTYASLAHGVRQQSGGRSSPIWLLALPVYWLLISVAGWRALYQLILDPFRWEKTPHGLANSSRNANIG